jgi:hypothetical protein
MRHVALVALVVLPACAPVPESGADPTFESWWQDGKAELDGYRLEITRYGEPRAGEGVMIFVTEPFSESKRVKVDDPSRDPADTFEALKLNLVRDFQTGIYDYNTMVSVFTRSSDFDPVKITFTSAEWCGQVYDELIFGEAGVDGRTFSYFDGETGDWRLERPAGGVSEDNLYVMLRGLRRPFLEPGHKQRFPFLPSTFAGRLTHVPLEWQSAEIERASRTSEVTVPAGTFAVTEYVVRAPGRVGRFSIEAAYPHRIVRWSWEAGARDAGGARRPAVVERGSLTGTARLAYWTLNGNGAESYREKLGLSPVRR